MADQLFVTPVPAEDLPNWWERLTWHFENFAERSGGARPVSLIAESVMKRESQCWVVQDQAGDVYACALTYQAPDAAKTTIVTACAGKEFEKWYALLLTTVHAWSVEAGSTKFEVQARPGWEKYLRQLGLRKTHVVMEVPHVGITANHLES